MDDIPTLDHALVQEGLMRFHALAAAAGRRAVSQHVAAAEEKYRSGIYRLVLVGEEKRGKSSLVSALLDEPRLLPAGPEPMTACVFKVAWGPALQHRVFFLAADPADPEGSRPAPRDVSPDEVADYGTESRNPGNAKRVDFIAVELPHPMLQSGLTIVDLPGLGGLKQAHGLLTLSYLRHADAAFFVLDSVAGPLTRAEVGTLERLREHTSNVIFVQTKIDIASTLSWQSWRDRNLEEIVQRLGVSEAAIHYFAVSSKLKMAFARTNDPEDLEDSGFEPLQALLTDDLIPRKQDRLALPLILSVIDEVAGIAQPIENEIAILTTQSEAELNRIEAELREGKRIFEEWRNDKLPQILARFRQGYGVALQNARRDISNQLDPAPGGPIVSALLQRVIDQELSATAIEDGSIELNELTVSLCGECLERIGKGFERTAIETFNVAADQIGQATRPVALERGRVTEGLPSVGPRIRGRAGMWNTAVQARMGYMAGTLAAGAVATLIFPPLGLAALAATALGGLFGASRSIADARRREREAALHDLRILLVDTVRRMNQRGSFELENAAAQNRDAMLESLQDAVRQRQTNEQTALAAIRDKRSRSREESAARIRVLTGHLDEARALIDCFDRAGAPIDDDQSPAAA